MMVKKITTEERIKEILDKVRPYVKMHGGDVHLISFKKGEAILEIGGACIGCTLADMTYNQMIGGIIKKEIPEVKNIVLISKS